MADFMLGGIFSGGEVFIGGLQGDNDQLVVASDETHRLN